MDREASDDKRRHVRAALEANGDSRVADMHVWRIAPRLFALEAVIETAEALSPDDYRKRLPADADIAHSNFEIRRPSARAYAAE